jgi:hypothetical protein
MSKYEKLLKRIQAKPVDFTWDELIKLLNHTGFEELSKGKTAGSRRQFFNADLKIALDIHKPHPRPTLKPYQIHDVLKTLKVAGLI